MSNLKKIKKAIYETPLIGRVYELVVVTYHYPKWRRKCRQGRNYVAGSPRAKFDISKPLSIEGLQYVELHPKPHKDLFQCNPTICLEQGGIRIYWRLTNWRDNPEADFWGRRKLHSALHGEWLLSRTAVGFLPILNGVLSDEIVEEGILEELDPVKVPLLDSISGAEQRDLIHLSYEDPKVLVSDPSLLTFTAVERGQSGATRFVKDSVALFDLKTRTIISLIHPKQSKREKNWVLAESTAKSVTLLRQSEPHHLVEFDRLTGALLSEKIQPNSGRAFLNGGSSFVLIDDSYYLRVARHRISLPRARNIHVSHIVKHDLDFNEIARSKPFVFRKFAFEICNGFEYDGSHFYFAWGENDDKIFVGRTTKEELLNWFRANESMQP